MKIYCAITPSHKILFEQFFLPSIEPSDFELFPVELEQSGKGSFLAEDWKNAIEFKVSKIIESIRANAGEIIMWSDVDIQFFGLKPEQILNYFQAGTDLVIQRFLLEKDVVCSGFFAIRCTEKAILFLEAVQLSLKDSGGNDQEAFNRVLKAQPSLLNWQFFRREYYVRTHGFRIPSNAVIHHATCILPGDNHIEQKIELLTGLAGFHHWNGFQRFWYHLQHFGGALHRRLNRPKN